MKSDSAIINKSEDLLGRYDFAIEIVEGLLKSFKNGQDSISIGINGEWGSGKSSILKFIESEIKNQTKDKTKTNIIFNFNPWLFSGQTDLQKSFLTQLGIQLHTINPKLKKLSEDIIIFSQIAEIANVFNPSIVGRSIIGGLTTNFKKILEKIFKESSIEDLKKKIDDSLKTSKIKLFVIIDDIDRLIPNEISNIFRLVKLNANFTNTFFFLAYDKSVVTKAIDVELHVEGEHFLEKIIQLDYSIPKLYPEILEELFIKNFNNVAETHNRLFPKKELGIVWDNGLKQYFSNLRHIYRFFNAFEIRYPGIKNEVNIIDFAVIEAIRIFDFKAFEWIYQHKEDFFYIKPLFPTGIKSKEEIDFVENIKNSKDIDIRDNTRDLITTIFRGIHLSSFSFSNESIDNDKLEKEKRLAHGAYFEHYFSFKVSQNNIAQAIIDRFINSEDNEKEIILKEFKESKLSLLLKRVLYSLPDDYSINSLRKFILDFSDKEHLQSSHTGQYNYVGLDSIILFLNGLGKKYDFSGYLEEILNGNSSYSRFYLQGFLMNKAIGSQNAGPVKDFPIELIDSNKPRILSTFHASLLSFTESYLAKPLKYEINIINDIFRLLHQEEIELYRVKIRDFLSEIGKTIILFRCSLTHSFYNGKESYTIQDDKYILPELTTKIFDDILSKVELETYVGSNKNYLEIFFKLKESNFNPQIAYTINLEKIEF